MDLINKETLLYFVKQLLDVSIYFAGYIYLNIRRDNQQGNCHYLRIEENPNSFGTVIKLELLEPSRVIFIILLFIVPASLSCSLHFVPVETNRMVTLLGKS